MVGVRMAAINKRTAEGISWSRMVANKLEVRDVNYECRAFESLFRPMSRALLWRSASVKFFGIVQSTLSDHHRSPRLLLQQLRTQV